jgi:hypothetical protein
MATKEERRKALKELHGKLKAAMDECEGQLKALEDGEEGGATKAMLDACKTVGDVAKILADAGDMRGAIMAARSDPRAPGQV